MAVFNNILAGASGATGAAGYQVDRSLRFNSGDSAYLNRTPASAGNRKTWTISFWVKSPFDGTNAMRPFFTYGSGASGGYVDMQFTASGVFQMSDWTTFFIQTSSVYRDPSAWYHFVVAVDTTQSTAADRVKLYVNGVEVTKGGSDPSLNYEFGVNNNQQQNIGAGTNSSNAFSAGSNFYLAEYHLIDGQQLDESDFGELDENNNWNPKEYSGSYGTNGFRLDFSDNSSNAALGTDSSGNDNDWTTNNISVSSGSGNDSLIDTPTNYDDGTNVGGNYCTWNPLFSSGTSLGFSEGNLKIATSSSTLSTIGTTIAFPTSGKWFVEVTQDSGTYMMIGVIAASASLDTSTYLYQYSESYVMYNQSGALLGTNSGSSTGSGATFGNGDVIGIALDLDNQQLRFWKNGTELGGFNSVTNTKQLMVAMSDHDSSSTTATLNTGQRPFAYTPPSNHLALCTTNLSDPTIADGSTAMDVALYTGNGSTQTISGLDFSPDLVWIKNRAQVDNHKLLDTVRGATKELESNTTDAEATNADGLTAFNSDGFALGADLEYNTSSEAYVAWAWDGGTSTVSNTDGSITSNVRANASAGFSIVSYTSTNVAGATVGHGLNAAMNFAIFKNRDRSQNWLVYHKSLDITSGEAINLNSTSAAYSSQAQFNSTLATNSVFTLGAGGNASYQAGDDMIAYCFAPVEGYSAFGSYTGTSGSNGAFVYTGMRPSFLLIKSTTRVSDWIIIDTTRDVDNLSNLSLEPNTSNAEASNTQKVDILSNGFKLRGTDGDTNANGASYIYAAFAEHPFKTARAR